MSTLAQIFESGSQKGDKGHFRNLVMLTRVDGSVSPEESKLLMRIARRLSLTEEQVKEIMDNEQDYPMVPPFTREERYERFIRFVQMIVVDGSVDEKEMHLVKKYGVQLGIDDEKIDSRYEEVLALCLKGVDAQEIMDQIL